MPQDWQPVASPRLTAETGLLGTPARIEQV